jgi:protein CpxP
MKIGGSKVLSATLALALLGSVAVAQGPHGPRGEGMFGPGMGFFADVLNLTDAQQTQIKQIFEGAKPTIDPLMEQEHQSHKAMMQLITSGNFDEAKAQSIAQQEASVHQQMEVEHAKLFAQAYGVLTASQKAQLAQIMANREARMQEHMQEKSSQQ